MQGSFSPIVPIGNQGLASVDSAMAFSSNNAVSKAISLNPDIAAKAIGDVNAGGVASLGNGQGISLNGTNSAHSPAEMKKVAQQFEAIFLRMLMQQMRSTVGKNSAMGESRAMEMFQYMQDDMFADRMSEHGIGLGDMVYRQMMARNIQNNQKVGHTTI